MTRNILFLLIILCTHWTNSIAYETAVAIKQGIQDYSDPVAVGVDNFIEFVRQSKIFVDTSLYIKEELTSDRPYYMVGPRNWGKTLNLDMLRTFLSWQIDESGHNIIPREKYFSYRYFIHGEILMEDGTIEKLQTPPLITKDMDLVMDNLGRYPVIYVNFKHVTGKDHIEIIDSIRQAIGRAFEDHIYMIEVLRNTSINHQDDTWAKRAGDKMTEFQHMLNGSIYEFYNEYDMIRSIDMLCEVIEDKFHQKAFVIFDDYDKVITNIMKVQNYPRHSIREAADFMDELSAWTLQYNRNVRRGIVVGTFVVQQYGHQYNWDSNITTDFARDSLPITDYFGLDVKDVHRMFEICNIPMATREIARKWYNGFKPEIVLGPRYRYHYRPKRASRQLYHPLSVVKFLKHKKIANYWNEPEDQVIVDKVINANFHVRSQLLSLLSRQWMPVWYLRWIGDDEITNLNAANVTAAVDDFFWFIYRVGYLAYQTVSWNKYRNDIWATLANHEMADELSNVMIKYYQREYHIENNMLNKASTKLLEYVDGKSTDTPSLQHTFTDLLAKCSWTEKNITEADMKLNLTTEDPIQSIFTCISLKMQCLSLFEIDVYYNKTINADMVIANNRTSQAFVVQISQDDETIEDTLKSATSHEQAIQTKLSYLKSINFLAFKVSPDKTVQVMAKN